MWMRLPASDAQRAPKTILIAREAFSASAIDGRLPSLDCRHGSGRRKATRDEHVCKPA